MESRMKYLEKIDFVLTQIRQTRDVDHIWLYALYVSKYPKNESDFEAITRKLIKDEFISVYPTIKQYNITFEGLCFEGYANREKAIFSEASRLQAMEDRNRQLAFWVALGTVGLLLFEILKYLTACSCNQ